MKIIQGTVLSQKTSRRLEKYYTESCLPKTKAIAFNSCETLLPLVRAFPSYWSFVDKVVVMLAPQLREEVERYYGHQGGCMETLYKSSQIEYLDELLARDLSIQIDGIQA